mmetsp:Transcript_15395/g.33115  ORF Transcript_15395/g.33115 Transcript_15395/m.33115 type:complete len:251 (+) Transcript_15395:1278-2030(+)
MPQRTYSASPPPPLTPPGAKRASTAGRRSTALPSLSTGTSLASSVEAPTLGPAVAGMTAASSRALQSHPPRVPRFCLCPRFDHCHHHRTSPPNVVQAAQAAAQEEQCLQRLIVADPRACLLLSPFETRQQHQKKQSLQWNQSKATATAHSKDSVVVHLVHFVVVTRETTQAAAAVADVAVVSAELVAKWAIRGPRKRQSSASTACGWDSEWTGIGTSVSTRGRPYTAHFCAGGTPLACISTRQFETSGRT